MEEQQRAPWEPEVSMDAEPAAGVVNHPAGTLVSHCPHCGLGVGHTELEVQTCFSCCQGFSAPVFRPM